MVEHPSCLPVFPQKSATAVTVSRGRSRCRAAEGQRAEGRRGVHEEPDTDDVPSASGSTPPPTGSDCNGDVKTGPEKLSEDPDEYDYFDYAGDLEQAALPSTEEAWTVAWRRVAPVGSVLLASFIII
ncbi:hypothetical protein U9M48_000603 [Paspalum notatum var. saurae]|uniref:Uncharacterized protein n=1 Tax=Paspalum notatum var. saurae TaxID=547442 RepID=A0AAQ3PFD3_PASNO